MPGFPQPAYNPLRTMQRIRAQAQEPPAPPLRLPSQALAMLRERRAVLTTEARYLGPGDTLEALALRTGRLEEIERLLQQAELPGDPTA